VLGVTTRRDHLAAAIDGVTGEHVQAKLPPSHGHIRSSVQGLPGFGGAPTGFDLYRALTRAGSRCEVAGCGPRAPLGLAARGRD
jgi:transposase